MEMPTVYVEEPEDSHEAWAALARLLEQIKSVFFLMAGATDPVVTQDEEETIQRIFHSALLGFELCQEADRRAETLRHFTWPDTHTPAIAEPQADQGKAEVDARE